MVVTFISKQDKTGSSGNPIALADYIEYLSKPNADTLMNSKITALSLGTASKKNTGTTNGTVPLIGIINYQHQLFLMFPCNEC